MIFSPDSKQIATGGADRQARIWSAATGNEIKSLNGYQGEVFGLAFSADGERIAAALADKTARIWDANTSEIIAVCAGHEREVRSVAFSANVHRRFVGRRIITGSGQAIASHGRTDRESFPARIWDAETGRQITALAAPAGEAQSIAISPSEEFVIAASGDVITIYHRPPTGEPATATMGTWVHAPGGRVTSIAFSRDGRRVVSGSIDGTARVWDFGTAEKTATLAVRPLNELGVVAPHVSCVDFSPDGSHVVVGYVDRTVRYSVPRAKSNVGLGVDTTSAVLALAQIHLAAAIAESRKSHLGILFGRIFSDLIPITTESVHDRSGCRRRFQGEPGKLRLSF